MDRKSLLILVICFLLLLLWPRLVEKVFPPTPIPNWTNAPAAGTNTLTDTASPGVTPTPPAAGAVPGPAVPPTVPVTPAAPEELLVVTRDNVRYTFTSHGGGLKQIELLNYRETVNGRRKTAESPPATLNAPAPLPALTLAGPADLQGSGSFVLSQPEPAVVRAEQQLLNGLWMSKEFRLGSNYQFTAVLRLENRSAQPLTVPTHELVFGTATPLSPTDDGLLVGVMHYNGSKAGTVTESWFANRTLGCLPGTPRTEYISPGTNVVWAAVHNQFFTIIAQPAGGAPNVIARRVLLPRPTREEVAANSRVVREPVGYQAAFLHPAGVLGAGQAVERVIDYYAGPKEYNTLSRRPNRQDLVMNFGFFGFFAKALLLSMNFLHNTLHIGYGWAIVVITVIIKLLFWPLTRASTRSMKRMAKLQPQMKALQEKYKDNPQKMNQKLMEFMKEHKVNPMGGCLPMLVQIPVFFGFFTMIQSAIELRGASFLWNHDLSKPDTLFIIPGINFPFNLLPLLMGVTMLWQTRLTPPSPGMDPMQQKIMKYLPLIFLVFLYNFSAGLTLYWTVQNLLTILQMKLTKNDDDPAVTVIPPVRGKGPAGPGPRPK
jgi:YidC/Oxa1 family membrane protein insertase